MLTNNAPEDKDVRKPVSQQEEEFDIEADLTRLKRSSTALAVVLVGLVLAFLIVLVLNLGGYFRMESIPTPPPEVVDFVYPKVDKAALYSEASLLSNPIALVSSGDQLIETKRVPGFVRVEGKDQKGGGWVEAENVETKAQTLATQKGLTGDPFELNLVVSIDKKDILLNGKITNKSNAPLKNILIQTYFLGPKKVDTVSTEKMTLYADKELQPGETGNFKMIGKDMLGKAPFLAYSVESFDAPPPPPPAEVVEPAQEVPAAAPAKGKAAKGKEAAPEKKKK